MPPTRIRGRQARGGALRVPRGADVRPTSAKVRKAIFDILGQRCDGDRVLDLYAGTGALGIEAATRGAAAVTWVENDPRVAAGLRRHAAQVPAGCDTEVLVQDAVEALDRLGRFDLVLADPPYDRGEVERLLAALASSDVLARGADVVVEHSPRERPPARVGGLIRRDERRYGQTCVSFFAMDDQTRLSPSGGGGSRSAARS